MTSHETVAGSWASVTVKQVKKRLTVNGFKPDSIGSFSLEQSRNSLAYAIWQIVKKRGDM